jgi:hypothetical protein
LDRIGVCGLVRKFPSQQACVDYWTEQVPDYPFDWTDDGQPCGTWFDSTGSGWSAPLINGYPATPAALQSLCPDGSPPPDTLGDNNVRYWKTAQFTGQGTPDIRRLVFKTGESTGDPIADKMFEHGNLPGVPDDDWYESGDCGSCSGEYEYDCSSSASKRFYTKTVEWEFSDGRSANDCITYGGSYCGCATLESPDVYGHCPPEGCKIVTITVTRTDKCSSPEVVTTWRAIINVCPCSGVFLSVDGETGDLWDYAYGFKDQEDCESYLTTGQCNNNQWKNIVLEDGDPMPQQCCEDYGVCE